MILLNEPATFSAPAVPIVIAMKTDISLSDLDTEVTFTPQIGQATTGRLEDLPPLQTFSTTRNSSSLSIGENRLSPDGLDYVLQTVMSFLGLMFLL